MNPSQIQDLFGRAKGISKAENTVYIAEHMGFWCVSRPVGTLILSYDTVLES